jgi:dihydrofolate reductase
MRKVLYGAACSLDGFIAGVHDEVDWLQWTDDVAEISKQVFSTTDTVLMGRRTYEAAARSGTTSYPGVQNYVFSRTLSPDAAPHVTIVQEDASAFVRAIAEQPGRDICVLGGGSLAASLFAHNLISEVGLNIHPLVLGEGIPMFPAFGRRLQLELLESRPLQAGCLLLRYRVR